MRLIVFFLLLCSSLKAQPVFFETVFGTAANDFCRGMVQLPNGTIFMAGYSDGGTLGGFDVSLAKLEKNGTLQWINYYGDTYNNNGLYINKTTDGNLVICGETYTANNGLDAFLLKIDTNGTLLWEKRYGGNLNESLKYVEQTTDGGYIMAGFHNDNFSSNNSYIIKTDAAGNLQWQQSIGGIDNDYADAVRQMSDGSYIVTADTKSFGAGYYDVELIKLNQQGNIIWDYTYGDAFNNGCQGLHLTMDGNLLSYGETEIFLFSPFDFYLEKIDVNGNSIWRKVFGGANADAAFSVTENTDGTFVLTGYSNSYNNGPINLVVLKTDSAGNQQWVRSYGSPYIDIGYKIINSVDGGLLIAGTTTDSVSSDAQYYLLHLDQTGLLTSTPSLNYQRQQITIYPNPAKDYFTVKSTANNYTITITDVNGKIIITHQSKQQLYTVYDHLPAGFYTITIESAQTITNNKLIITR